MAEVWKLMWRDINFLLSSVIWINAISTWTVCLLLSEVWNHPSYYKHPVYICYLFVLFQYVWPLLHEFCLFCFSMFVLSVIEPVQLGGIWSVTCWSMLDSTDIAVSSVTKALLIKTTCYNISQHTLKRNTSSVTDVTKPWTLYMLSGDIGERGHVCYDNKITQQQQEQEKQQPAATAFHHQLLLFVVCHLFTEFPVGITIKIRRELNKA